jgi:replicative DNA helicase
MTRAQLFDRMLACYGIPLPQVESRRPAPAYEDALERALKETAKWRVEINDERSANHATFRRWQRLRHYDLIVIDHLHEIDIEGRAADRRVNLEQELLRIASVARDLDVPILLLAQLSRGEGRPNLAKLRESGRIEQVAAQVQFIWRKPTESGEPGTEAELIVAKDRFGPTGKMPLHFDGEMVRFTEVEERAA